MQVIREQQRVLAVTPGAATPVSAQDVRGAAAFVVRAALAASRLEDWQSGPLSVTHDAEHLTLHVARHPQRVPVSIADAVAWLRALGEAPLGWSVTGPHVTLHLAGVTVWTAGPQTAAVFGVALALTLEHPGVFFSAGAPFAGATPTALLPDTRPTEKAVRIAAFTSKRYGLHLQDVGRATLPGTEYATLQRQLLGVLRALMLEQPQAVPALRTLEALVT